MLALDRKCEGELWGEMLEYSPHELIRKVRFHSVNTGALSAAEAEPIPTETKWRAQLLIERFTVPGEFFEAAQKKQFFGLRQLLASQVIGYQGIRVTEIVSATLEGESAYVIRHRPDGIKTLALCPVERLLAEDRHIFVPVW